MSEPLKAGDSVIIVPDKYGQIYDGCGNALISDIAEIINREQGEILYVDSFWGSAHVKLEDDSVLDISLECLTRAERPRRTFEEIINDLKQFGWHVWYEKGRRGADMCDFYINHDGSLSFETEPSTTCGRDELGADELIAIAAACQEIAANCQAEHGKKSKEE